MTDQAPRPTGGTAATASEDASLDAVRDILLRRSRARQAELETELARIQAEIDALEAKIDDEDSLIATISPVMGDAIRRSIRDSREEMVEALYPIIGQLVVRAVSEAVRDLARGIDAQMRRSFSPQAALRRIGGRFRGISGGELALRDALPFTVEDVFLIHRESGLLVRHVSLTGDLADDSDLVSGMLTAIRDFAADTFGRNKVGQLDEIQYGGRRVLIEAAQNVYLAVVADGIEPSGFRAEMRARLMDVENRHRAVLRAYDGDAERLAAADALLQSLIPPAPPSAPAVSPPPRAGLIAVTLLVLALTLCALGVWAWRSTRAPSAAGLPATASLHAASLHPFGS